MSDGSKSGSDVEDSRDSKGGSSSHNSDEESGEESNSGDVEEEEEESSDEETDEEEEEVKEETEEARSARDFHEQGAANFQGKYMQDFLVKKKLFHYDTEYTVAKYSPFTEIPRRNLLELELQSRKAIAHKACVELADDPNDVKLVNRFATEQLNLAKTRGKLWEFGFYMEDFNVPAIACNHLSASDDCVVRLNVIEKHGDPPTYTELTSSPVTQTLHRNVLFPGSDATAAAVLDLLLGAQLKMKHSDPSLGEEARSILLCINNPKGRPNNWLSNDFGKEPISFTEKKTCTLEGGAQFTYSISKGVCRLDKTKPWDHPKQLDKINKAFKVNGFPVMYYDLVAEIERDGKTREYSWTMFPYKARHCVVSTLSYRSTKHTLISKLEDIYDYTEIPKKLDFKRVKHEKYFVSASSVPKNDEIKLWQLHSERHRGGLGNAPQVQAYVFSSQHTVILASSIGKTVKKTKPTGSYYTTCYTIFQYTNEIAPPEPYKGNFAPQYKDLSQGHAIGSLRNEVARLQKEIDMKRASSALPINDLIPGIIKQGDKDGSEPHCYALWDISPDRLKQIHMAVYRVEREIIRAHFAQPNNFYTIPEGGRIERLYSELAKAYNTREEKDQAYAFPGMFINSLIAFRAAPNTKVLGNAALKHWSDYWSKLVTDLGSRSEPLPTDKEFKYALVDKGSRGYDEILVQVERRRELEAAHRQRMKEHNERERNFFGPGSASHNILFPQMGYTGGYNRDISGPPGGGSYPRGGKNNGGTNRGAKGSGPVRGRGGYGPGRGRGGYGPGGGRGGSGPAKERGGFGPVRGRGGYGPVRGGKGWSEDRQGEASSNWDDEQDEPNEPQITIYVINHGQKQPYVVGLNEVIRVANEKVQGSGPTEGLIRVRDRTRKDYIFVDPEELESAERTMAERGKP